MKMRSTFFRGVLACVPVMLIACSTTEQPDGSTKVRISLGELLKAPPPNKAPAQTPQTIASPAMAVPTAAVTTGSSIRTTATTPLANLFAKHPYDGTPKSYFPRAAITVTDWSRSDCWTAVATIWRSSTKSESVAPFSVCWGKSMGFSINNAANLHLFMQQSSVQHSGNVRTAGPKPPMLVIPDRSPIGEAKQLDFQGFVQQLLLDTGWKPGAPTNIWLVGYDANAAKTSSGRPSSL